MSASPPEVATLSRSRRHHFSKDGEDSLTLLAGLGVEGDCHAGATVQHLSRKRRDPSQPNLRQVHLIHSELYAELRAGGFEVAHGELGENITTQNLDLLALPRGALLRIGTQVVLELTGLRNPCVQIDRFRAGMLAAVLDRDESGTTVRKAGVMSVVRVGGTVHRSDVISVERPAPPLLPLLPV